MSVLSSILEWVSTVSSSGGRNIMEHLSAAKSWWKPTSLIMLLWCQYPVMPVDPTDTPFHFKPTNFSVFNFHHCAIEKIKQRKAHFQNMCLKQWWQSDYTCYHYGQQVNDVFMQVLPLSVSPWSLCLMVKVPFEKQAREEHKLINIPFLKSNAYLQSCGFSQCLDVNPSLCCRPQVHHNRSAILRKHHIARLQVSVTQSRSTISTHAWDTVCRHGAKGITQSTPLRREAYQYECFNE